MHVMETLWLLINPALLAHFQAPPGVKKKRGASFLGVQIYIKAAYHMQAKKTTKKQLTILNCNAMFKVPLHYQEKQAVLINWKKM